VNRIFRSAIFYIVLAVVALLLISNVFRGSNERTSLRLDDFEHRIAAGEVRSADVSDKDNQIKGELKNGTRYKVNYVKEDAPNVLNELRRTDAKVHVSHHKDPVWLQIVETVLPFALLIGVFLFVMNMKAPFSTPTSRGALPS